MGISELAVDATHLVPYIGRLISIIRVSRLKAENRRLRQHSAEQDRASEHYLREQQSLRADLRLAKHTVYHQKSLLRLSILIIFSLLMGCLILWPSVQLADSKAELFGSNDVLLSWGDVTSERDHYADDTQPLIHDLIIDFRSYNKSE
jgi:hypothetical protein